MNVFALLLITLLGCIGGLPSPFDYDLHLTTIPGRQDRTLICMHGYGGNYQIAKWIQIHKATDVTLVSFNFPEYDLDKMPYDPERASFGTIDELFPALYVLKKCVIEEGRETIDLYGYSAGGGVVVNLIALLNTTHYDAALQEIGLGQEEKTKLLNAIQKGVVLLDVPLKSIEEIIEGRGWTAELEILAAHYRMHGLRPIDALSIWNDLCCDVILYIQEPDTIVCNRDDAVYIDRLQQANVGGTTTIVRGAKGDHFSFHSLLWQTYAQHVKKGG